MIRILATTATIVLVLGSAAAASGAEVEAPRVTAAPSIAWGECDNLGLQSRKAECGFLSVPLDYAEPGGKKI